MSHFGVTVKPFPILASLRILAMGLGLLQRQPPQDRAVGLVEMGSVEAGDVVHGVSPC